jgi:hypothetical protein
MANALKSLLKKMPLPSSCCCDSRCTKCAVGNDAARAGQNSRKSSQQGWHTEKEKDAAEQEVQRLQQLLQVTRARTHATTVNDHEECDKKSSDDWDLVDYRLEDARIQTRHSTPLGSRAKVPTPQEGKAGPLEHSRLGIIGWIVYWSLLAYVNPDRGIPRMTCWRRSLKKGMSRSKTKGFGRDWSRLTMLHTSNRKKISCFGLNTPTRTKNLSRCFG